MIKFTILKKAHDAMQPPKVIEVRLGISGYEASDDGFPTLTHWCATEIEVEAKFDRVIASIQKKKSEALAIVKKSRDSHAGTPKGFKH
jgi:hypothetical protein